MRASGERGNEVSETSEVADTRHSRFTRLLQLVEAAPEDAGWIELPHLGDLADAGYGALVTAEVEIYVPDTVRMLGRDGGASKALSALGELLPAAQALGLDTDLGEGIDADTIGQMSGFLNKLSGGLVFVGEDDDSDWKVAGRLSSAHLLDNEVEGFVRVVGKLSKRWPEGRWKPLLALPGASLVPRKEQKALESRKPDEADSDQYLEGPAVMLDVLAIYR